MKILLIQLRRIGDVLMTTPAVRELRKAHPNSFIAYLTEAPSDQVLRMNANIDEIYLYNKKGGIPSQLDLIKKIRRDRFDVVIDLFGNPTSAIITLLSGAPKRLGFDFRLRKYAYTVPVKAHSDKLRYAALDKLDLLAELGVGAQGHELDFSVSEEDERFAEDLFVKLGVLAKDFVVSLSPVSRQPYKVWPAENFARIADGLIERHNAKILFISGPGEQHFVDSVRGLMKQQALPDYPVPSLRQTLAIIKRADLHVGNDNGPRHFAIACGTPSVAVFGRPFADNWTPPDSQVHASVEHDPGCKSECRYPNCGLECIRDLSIDEVWPKIEQILEQIKK
jgi:heptosyltransferase-3